MACSPSISHLHVHASIERLVIGQTDDSTWLQNGIVRILIRGGALRTVQPKGKVEVGKGKPISLCCYVLNRSRNTTEVENTGCKSQVTGKAARIVFLWTGSDRLTKKNLRENL